jgi:uncharacterized spore protein YtfJ
LGGGSDGETIVGLVQRFQRTVDAVTVHRVFGEPFSRGEVTVIPVAAIRGGGGGGAGHDAAGQDGEGGGFGFSARPVGVYLVTDRGVRWRPVVDVDRLVAATVVVAGIVVVTGGRLHRGREVDRRRVRRSPRRG